MKKLAFVVCWFLAVILVATAMVLGSLGSQYLVDHGMNYNFVVTLSGIILGISGIFMMKGISRFLEWLIFD